MKSICNFSSVWKKILASSLLSLSALSACSRTESTDVPVSIHAVNYSDQEFEYSLSDPANQANSAGGESIGRYAAGGTMCCYTLPKRWRPGMKIKIDYELYFPRHPGESLRKIISSSLIEIPKYLEPQELWLVRDAKGEMNIVLSNFQPGHPKWPGEVKGWPVASLAYQHERWILYMEHERDGVKLFKDMLKKISDNPEKETKNAWPDEIKYHPELKNQFSGPDDPKFLTYLKKDYERAIERSQEIMRELEETKP